MNVNYFHPGCARAARGAAGARETCTRHLMIFMRPCTGRHYGTRYYADRKDVSAILYYFKVKVPKAKSSLRSWRYPVLVWFWNPNVIYKL